MDPTAVGYANYPDNVVREFVVHSSEAGMDVFRIFDSLNYLPNLKVAMETVNERTKSLCEAALCYTGDFTDPKEEKYVLKYYVDLAKELEKMGAHIIAIKDMAGLCHPTAVNRLVKALGMKFLFRFTSIPMTPVELLPHPCSKHPRREWMWWTWRFLPCPVARVSPILIPLLMP